MIRFFLPILLLSLHADAENFSTTNIQYLMGTTFTQVPGDRIDNGRMDTVTLEHFGTWEYGSNYFFVDLTSGDFQSGKSSDLYAEYSPALSLSKITRSDLSWGIIKDLQLAAQINQGDNYRVLMAGAGLAFDIPGFQFVTLNLYSRKDDFNAQTWQTTAAWHSEWDLWLHWTFEGFADYYGIDDGSVLVSQPQLLVNLPFISPKIALLRAGMELAIYGIYSDDDASTWLTPQMMIKWIW